MSRNLLGIVLALLAGFFWGTAGIFVNMLSEYGWISAQMVFSRMLFSFIFVFIFTIIVRPSILKVKFKDLWCFAGAGFISIAMLNFLYYILIKNTSMSIATTLEYVAPVMVVFMSAVIFKEKITKISVFASLIAFLGCAAVSGIFLGKFSISPFNLLLGLGCAFCYATYSVFSRFAIKKGYDSITITAYTFLFSVIGISFMAKVPSTVYDICHKPKVLLISIAFSLIDTVIPYVLYTISLNFTNTGTASIMTSMEPVSSLFFQFVVFNQPPTLSGILGIILILTAVVMVSYNRKQVSN